MMLKTHFPLKLNNQLYAETTKQEEVVLTPTSSPSPPASSPHSPAEDTRVPSSPAPPELPEILSLCQRLNPSIEDLNKKRITAAEFMNILVRELTPFIHKNMGPKKTIKKKRERGSRQCSICLTVTTPEWRRDPDGLVTLCNACGLKVKKKARTAPTTAMTSPSFNGQRFHSFQQSQPFVAAENRSPPLQRAAPQPLSAYTLPAVTQQNTSAATYQTFHTYKIEENSHPLYNHNYQQSQLNHQENLPINNLNQYQYYYNDDSFPYQSSPQSYHQFHTDEDRQNCPQCFPHYAAY